MVASSAANDSAQEPADEPQPGGARPRGRRRRRAGDAIAHRLPGEKTNDKVVGSQGEEVPERESRPPNRQQRRSLARMREYNHDKRMRAEQAVELAASSIQQDEEGHEAAASVTAEGAAPVPARELALEPATHANPTDDERVPKRPVSSPARGGSSQEHRPDAPGSGSSRPVKRLAAHANQSPRPRLIPRQLMVRGAPSPDMTR